MRARRNHQIGYNRPSDQNFVLKEPKKSMSMLKKKLRNSKSSNEFKSKEKQKLFLTKEISKIMDNNVSSFMNGQKCPPNNKCKLRKYTHNIIEQPKEICLGSVVARHTSLQNNTGDFKFENRFYDMINELEANDNISMKVSELNTPQQKKFRELKSDHEEDEDFSADIEDIEEENIGDIRRKVRCFWDHSKGDKSCIETSDKDSKLKPVLKEELETDNTFSIYEQKFIEEFWKVIHEQNGKITYLLNENDKLKLQLKSIQESNEVEFLTIKSKLKKFEDLRDDSRSKTPVESISEYVKHRNCEIMNPFSKNLNSKLFNLKNAQSEYMIIKSDHKERIMEDDSDYKDIEPQNDYPCTTEGKLAKLYRSKKNSVDCFETFSKQQLADAENDKIVQKEYSTESSPIKKMIKSSDSQTYRFKKKWCK